MSSDHLPYPWALSDYRGPIRITYQLADGRESSATQPVGPIPKRPIKCECDQDPRVIVQAIDHGQRNNGSAWTWDAEGDMGRGAWVTYDPGIHEPPMKSSATLPDVGPESRSVDLSSKSAVELRAEAAPEPAPPVDEEDVEDEVDPIDDDFDMDEDDEDEPSYDDDEDDEEDDEPAV